MSDDIKINANPKNLSNFKSLEGKAIFNGLFIVEKNLKICFQIRILRVNNTYLTYTMDFNPGRRSPGF